MSSQKEFFDRFLEFIYSMIKRPAMYGVSDVEGVHLFVLGVRCGCGGCDGEIMTAFSNDFRDFINDEFAEDFSKKRDHDWPRLIRFYSGGDLHSIELLGLMLDKFVPSFKKKYQLN
jgi:hypothetical protein